MNVHVPEIAAPTAEEARAALALLRAYADNAPAAEARALAEAAYPTLSRVYPEGLRVDEAYRASLPDLQNGPESLIRGAHARIHHVGISNFRLPLTFATRDGGEVSLEASVTGSVSLEADRKGINMSRILRSFYARADQVMGVAALEGVLQDYLRDLGSYDARIALAFSYPIKVQALRSGLSGWQYYDVVLELVMQAGVMTRIMHFDSVYSSTCPCSLELSEHARRTRGQLATPHSQRSVARLSVVLRPGTEIAVEDLADLCRRAVPTETQVMVKREDEQAFAELNAANPIFVEDAARLFCEGLRADPRVGDFRVVASHQESLHSHDAISVLTEGPTFAGASLEPHLFRSLIHTR